MIISIDLDGTLVNSYGVVPENTAKYLNELKKQGEIIVLNTGRTLKEAFRGTHDAYFANYIISDTGAVIYDVELKKKIREMNISNEDGYRLFKENGDVCREFSIFIEGYEYLYHKDFEKYEDIIKDDTNISHISIEFNFQEQVKRFVEENQPKFPNLRIFAMVDSFGTEEWIEIINKKAGKFNALLALANMHNMSKEDIIAFGDAINDLDVIQNSKIGIAMKNAVPKIKQYAKSITEFSNDECGVEKWLRKYYLKKEE